MKSHLKESVFKKKCIDIDTIQFSFIFTFTTGAGEGYNIKHFLEEPELLGAANQQGCCHTVTTMKIALLASILWVNWIDLVSARSTRSLSTDRMFLAVDTLEQSELSRKKKKGSGESGSGSSESGGKSDLIECSCPSGPGTSIRSESLADRKKKKNKGKKSSEECSCEETATEIGVITAAPTKIIAAAPTW